LKFLLVLAVLVVAFYIWRANRKPERPAPPGAARPPEPPQLEMVRCAVCGLHLPKTDAITTQAAAYCSNEHRQQAER
jgi:uncharacterized protein